MFCLWLCNMYISGLTRGCNFPQLIGAVFNWPADIYSFNLLLRSKSLNWISYQCRHRTWWLFMWLKSNLRPIDDICFEKLVPKKVSRVQNVSHLYVSDNNMSSSSLNIIASQVLVIFDICLMAVSFIFSCLSVNPSITLARTLNIIKIMFHHFNRMCKISFRCNIAKM